MKLFIQAVCLLFFVLANGAAFADSMVWPESTVDISQNGKVVYINWLDKKKPIALSYSDDGKYKVSKNEFSIENYPQSGLYLIKDRKFLWQLKNEYKDYYFSSTPLNDQEHMVVFGPWASSLGDTAFDLYKNGKLIKSLKIKDFCSDSSEFQYTASHFFWMEDYNLDESRKLITFFACRKVFSIDVQTGEFSFQRKYIILKDLYDFVAIFSLCSLVIFPIILVIRIYMAYRNIGTAKQRRTISIVALISLFFIVLGGIMLFLN